MTGAPRLAPIPLGLPCQPVLLQHLTQPDRVHRLTAMRPDYRHVPPMNLVGAPVPLTAQGGKNLSEIFLLLLVRWLYSHTPSLPYPQSPGNVGGLMGDRKRPTPWITPVVTRGDQGTWFPVISLACVRVT